MLAQSVSAADYVVMGEYWMGAEHVVVRVDLYRGLRNEKSLQWNAGFDEIGDGRLTDRIAADIDRALF